MTKPAKTKELVLTYEASATAKWHKDAEALFISQGEKNCVMIYGRDGILRLSGLIQHILEGWTEND